MVNKLTKLKNLPFVKNKFLNRGQFGNIYLCNYNNKHLVGGKNASLGELYTLSQKINFKPTSTTASAVEIQVLTGTIASLPFFNFNAFIANKSASVPFATETQYFEPANFENSDSNFTTSSPPIN